MVIVAFMGAFEVFGPVNRFVPALEWASVLYLVNFYTVMAMVNPFYESVHQIIVG